jgi:uncharacterized delta-60 repeat protein
MLAAPLPAMAQSGTLDVRFGLFGRVITDFAGGSDAAAAVAVQPDGRIVAAGWTTANGSADFALARYHADGTLDASFGSGGKVTTAFRAGSLDMALAVALQPDGKIVAAGQTSSGNSDFALARYNVDGTLDASFGANGTVATDFLAQSSDAAFAVVVQADGKIVAAGQANVDGGFDFALARYNNDGTLDAAFGAGGKVLTAFVDEPSGQDFSVAQAFAVALQADGKIVTAGQAFIENGFDFAVARYNSDGTLDVDFGTRGRVTTNFASGHDRARAVAIQPDGRIVAAGGSMASTGFDFALARYDGNGTLDPTFGGSGKVTTEFAGASDFAFSAIAQPDGKIVAAGQSLIAGSSVFALARYTSTGTLDATFGFGGRMVSNFPGTNEAALSVALQADGKVVAAGRADVRGGDFAIARYK